MKRILIASLLIACSTHTRIYYNTALPVSLTPKSAQFAWDLHDVLFKKRSGLLVFKALKHIGPLSTLSLSRTKKYKRLRKELKALKQSGATGQAYYQFLLSHGEQKLAKAFKECAAQQKPITGMEELICTLAHLGYTQHIASNIGDLFLQELKRQPKNRHILTHLNDGTCAIYDNGTAVLRKPDKKFYDKHTHQYNSDGTQLIIFIDDKLENIHAAVAAGWVGILFENPRQLRNDLCQLGITLTHT